MTVFASIGRVAEAFLTALGVVLGLVPDPTTEQVPVRIERDPYR